MQQEAISTRKADIARRIQTGLHLETVFPFFSELSRQIIVDTIASTYDTSCRLLNIPANAEFSYLDEKDIEKKTTARFIPTNPSKLLFNPHKLLSIANSYKEGNIPFVSDHALNDLRRITAHETYHQYELTNLPNRSSRMGNFETGEIYSQALAKRSDTAAEIFAIGYIRHRNHPHILSKIVSSLSSRQYAVADRLLGWI